MKWKKSLWTEARWCEKRNSCVG